jgi:hypothetical protein
MQGSTAVANFYRKLEYGNSGTIVCDAGADDC